MNKNLLLIGAALLSGLVSFFIPVMHADEGGWAVLGKHAWDGTLYQGLTDLKPPLFFQIHWLFSFGEHSLIAARFFTSLGLGLGAIGLYSFFKPYLEEKRAFLGALLFALTSGLLSGNAFHAERLYLPFLIFAVLLAQKASSKKNHTVLLSLGVGFLWGAAACIKQPALILGSPILLFLIQTPRPFLALWVTGIGGASLTFLSWSLTQVPWNVIWQEAYLSNFEIMNFTFSHYLKSYLLDILENIFFTFGVQFLPLTLGSILSLRKWRRLRELSWNQLALLLTFVVTTLWMVSLGKRFYHYYYLAALPLLSFFAAVGVDLKQKRFYVGATLMIVFALNIRLGVLQFLDKNKNWDSEIQHVISEIKKDTHSDQSIWASANLYSVYYFSEREPAVKHLWFETVLHHVNLGNALERWLCEDLTNPKYQQHLEQLKANQPQVIFWTERAEAHRLKLENFPGIKQLIDQNYEKKWQSSLGTYYLRKNI